MPITMVTMIAFYMGLRFSPMVASSCAFATLALARLFHGFNCRSDKSIFSIKLLSNKWTVGAFLAGTILLAMVIFVPFLRKLFSVAYLSLGLVSFIVILAFIPTLLIQLLKGIIDFTKRKR